MDQLGGLLRRLPFVGAALMMAGFAGCGLPGFANFAGEVTVLFGAWKAFRLVTILACWGALLIGAVYVLRALRATLQGPLPEKWAKVADASNLWRKAPFTLLLASLLVFGFFPRLLTDKIQPSVEPIVARFSVPSLARASSSAAFPLTKDVASADQLSPLPLRTPHSALRTQDAPHSALRTR
jgi:NADH-quinone oxidoreductase subunit M